MRMHVLFVCLVLPLLCGGFAGSAYAEDWPNWRGPNHDGVSTETGLKTDWTGKPTVVWDRELGASFSAAVFTGSKLYTCGTIDDQQTLLCLDAGSGRTLWRFPFEKHFNDSQGGDGARGTPTVREGMVYVQGAYGRLICCDAETGKLIWDHKFNSKPRWGYSGSVLIEGDLAVIIGGDDDGPLVALDKKTGQVKWTLGGKPIGYSTPYPFTLDGRRYIAAFLGGNILVADAKSGAEAWSMKWKTDWNVNAATPIFHDGHLLFSSGYKHGSALVKLTPAGEKLSGEVIWQGRAIRAKFQTPVLYEGHLYTSDEVGLRCVEFMTGAEKWSKRGVKYGTVVLAEGHLHVLTENGRLMIAEATPEGFTPRTDVQILDGRCWTVPTIYQGRLYARNLERMVCLKLTP